jgi:tetratricopeptide (TPR) repeat protein
MKKLLLLTAILGCACRPSAAQDSELGRKIYSENAPSVLLLYVKSPDGEYVAQGSGFLLDGGQIATNAHVANAGKVFIDLGSARIPTKLEKLDAQNDLAVLSAAVEIEAKALKLADKRPSPGDVIFAITNPEGLERTISQGVVSADREVGGRKLMQISTPISHGSSGGPIFNRDGRVVGIAVGTLAEGQNLNFAVPAELLTQLLSGTSTSGSDLNALIEQIASLQTLQAAEQYSDKADSGYQKTQSALESLLNQGAALAGNNPESLLKVAQLAKGINVDIALTNAKRAVDARPSSEAYLLLAEILNSKYIWQQGDERSTSMRSAEEASRWAIKLARVPSAEMYYRLGDTLQDEGRCVEAENVLEKTLSLTESDPGAGVNSLAVRDLMLCAGARNLPTEESRWFDELEKSGNASGYDWDTHAQYLSKTVKYKEAGEAYSHAAATFKRDWCTAGTMFDLASDADSSRSANRKCIEALTGTNGSESNLGWAHASIASTLNARGVYSEALSHAKEATTLDPSNPWAFLTEADTLNNLQRFNEAINAAKEAIRLSDGKYPTMHFTLGTSYFNTENWQLARQSYEKAAELDTADDPSAYNVAVCYARLGYYNDAAHWYEEALRRNPKRDDRDDLKHRIDVLRR